MEETCASMIDGIELRWWLYDIIMHCERMMINESLIALFMFAYQIWWILRWEKPQGREFDKRKRKCGWEFIKRKRKCGREFGKGKRKGLGFQQIYGVANLISKHEIGEKKLALHGQIHSLCKPCTCQKFEFNL